MFIIVTSATLELWKAPYILLCNAKYTKVTEELCKKRSEV